jgi:hypothetical protein
MIAPLVEQGGVDFRRALIGERRLAQQVEHGLAFCGAQRPVGTGSGARWHRRSGPTGALPVDAGAGKAQRGTGGGGEAAARG